jgi:flagellar protein FliJ
VNKNFPLQSILDLSQMKLEESTRRLGELIASEQEAMRRLELLTQYRDEYHQRFMAAAKDGLTREQWGNYQRFLEKLDTAITQAKDMIAQTQQLTTAGQKDWMDKRGKVKAFDTLAHRHQAQVNHAEARQEQKIVDERSARDHNMGKQED